jgi:hypothetical protein
VLRGGRDYKKRGATIEPSATVAKNRVFDPRLRAIVECRLFDGCRTVLARALSWDFDVDVRILSLVRGVRATKVLIVTLAFLRMYPNSKMYQQDFREKTNSASVLSGTRIPVILRDLFILPRW